MKDFQRARILNSFLKVDHLTLKNKNGETYSREVVMKQDAVCAIVRLKSKTDCDRYLFTKQWRPGALDHIVELVAGTCDIEGESKEECIKREIIEELGYKVDLVKELVKDFYVSPGYSTEKMSIFYCEVSEKISEGGGVSNENIEVIEMNVAELIEGFYSGYFNDAKTLIGLRSFFAI
jgi:nudix-type nucleoside diphosphatase (YffH/AdpP family)